MAPRARQPLIPPQAEHHYGHPHPKRRQHLSYPPPDLVAAIATPRRIATQCYLPMGRPTVPPYVEFTAAQPLAIPGGPDTRTPTSIPNSTLHCFYRASGVADGAPTTRNHFCVHTYHFLS